MLPAASSKCSGMPQATATARTRHAPRAWTQIAICLPVSSHVQAEERGGSFCARSPLTSNPQSGRMLRSLLAAATDAFACRVSSSRGHHVFRHLAPRRPPMLTAHRSSRRRTRHACGCPLPCTRRACGHVVRALSGAVRFSRRLTTPLARVDRPLAFPFNTANFILSRCPCCPVDEAPCLSGPLFKAACHHLTSCLPALPALPLQLQRDLTSLCTHPGTSDPDTLASHLTSAGYSASVRRAVGGCGSSCFRNLRHEFLVVKGDGKDSRDDYVVDLRFREQFQISHPTPDYAALLVLLPEAYAGPVSAVMPIVQVGRASMCSVVASGGGDEAGEKAREGWKDLCHA